MKSPDFASDYDVITDYTALLSQCENANELASLRAKVFSDNRLTLIARQHMAGLMQIKIDKLVGGPAAAAAAPAAKALGVPKPTAPVKPLSTTVAEGFAPKDIDQAMAAIKVKPEHKLIVRDASEMYNVPPGFIVVFEDKLTGRLSPYILKAGMLWKLREWGFRSVDVEVVPDPDHKGGYLGTARITPNLSAQDTALLGKMIDAGMREEFHQVYQDLMRPTVAHSSANPGNLKEMQLPWAREMAETRATLRAARVFTGCGLATPEEEQEAMA